MTNSAGNSLELTVEDANRMAAAIAPGLENNFRKGVKADLDYQTKEIGAMVAAHEVKDTEHFSAIEGRLKKIETKILIAGVIVSAIGFIAPPLISALISRLLGK